MKNQFAVLGLALLILTSCQKNIDSFESNVVEKKVPSKIADTLSQFVKYTIAKGAQYCDKNDYKKVSYSQLKFVVKFDSSAIYSNVDPKNQYDINKLFGFSDNNKFHHLFSARFGWRWSDNALRLFGYIYNNGVMSFKELGTVSIGSKNSCSIKVTANSYIFTLNGGKTIMPRLSTSPTAEGYKLYPYFGGDEVSPHEISIWIKEL